MERAQAAKSAEKPEKERKTRREKPNKPPKKGGDGAKKAVIIVAVVLALLLAGFAGAGFALSGTDTIFPGVTVGGVNLGGMTREAAAEHLQALGWDETDNNEVTVLLPLNSKIVVSAQEAGAEVSAVSAAVSAYDYGHRGNVFGSVVKYLGCLLGGRELELVPEVDEAAVREKVESVVGAVTKGLMSSGVEVGEDSISVIKGAKAVNIDVDAICEQITQALKTRSYTETEYEVQVQEEAELDLDGLYESVFAEVADAYFDAETKEIVPSRTGYDFDRGEAQRLWDAADYGDRVVIPLAVTEPEMSTEALAELLYADVLGTKTTSLAGSSANRITNVQLACEAIDGLILAPGESLSYNAALGERTTAKGYKAAGAYSGGQVVQEVGGGICQVSSTLYYSTLLANLQIDVRSCHYFGVAYLPPGLDATVSWRTPDFKFTNNRDYPIRIEASVDTEENTTTVSILGTDVDGSYVELSYASWPVYRNEEYPEIATGYKATSYRSVFDSEGNLISKTTEAQSEYHYHEEDIPYPSPSPSVTPEPSALPDASAEPTVPAVATDDPAQATETPVITETPSPTTPVTDGSVV